MWIIYLRGTASLLILFNHVHELIVDELSKVKKDLEAALKDVLQAMKINQEAVSVPRLEKLASVSRKLMLNSA